MKIITIHFTWTRKFFS